MYKVIDPATHKLYAFKSVKLKGTDPAVLQGYLNEIELLNRLSSLDTVIRLFDFEVIPGKELRIVRVLSCSELTVCMVAHGCG